MNTAIINGIRSFEWQDVILNEWLTYENKMSQITLQKVSFGYTDLLFEDVGFSITEKDRVGIVGDNGSGKSTLLKCIAGVIPEYSGQIVKPRNFKFGFIEQDIPNDIKELTLYSAIADKISPDEKDYNLWKVDLTLDIFKAPDNIRNKTIKELSGGWQRLALLGRVFMSNPDIFLLDEPTNHLDVGKILVLEEWLKTQISDTPIIVVSHDRRFLDACTNRTIFLRGGQASDYKYSYSRARELLLEDDKTASNQRKKELEELERLQKSAQNLRQIGVDNYSTPALNKAKQIEKRAEKLRVLLTPIYIAPKREVKLSSSDTHAKRLVLLEDVQIKAPDGRHLFQIEKLEIAQGDRVVILGPNGSGKSQFIQHLNRAFADPETSKKHGIYITPTAKLGYIDQHLSNLPLSSKMKDLIQNVTTIDNARVTSTLVSIGFPYETQEMKIGELSQGQRSRLNLLILRLTEPNFYIMDEPTNHLDIDGQEALEREIIEHGAASILVSHDRTFVENLGTRFYEIYKGELRLINSPEVFYNSIDVKINLVNAKKINYDSEQQLATKFNSKNITKKDKQINPEDSIKFNLNKVEECIMELEGKIKLFENKMHNSTQLQNYNEVEFYLNKYNELKEQLEIEMQKWQKLMESLNSQTQ